MPQITKIVITGGPCAGKSTALSMIDDKFSSMGYRVLFVPETATELILGGLTPKSCKTNHDFQHAIIDLQIQKEKVFEQAARGMEDEKILIVCDRGLLDCKAYMSSEEFNSVLNEYNTSEVIMRDTYDAVFHLATVAKGVEEFYTTENNNARTETAEEAAMLDDKIIAAWTGHPHLRIIDNSTDFEKKIDRLLNEICVFLGEPQHFEVERKFLIKYPNIEILEKSEHCTKTEIIQTYLVCNEKNEELRIRQRGNNGNYIYIKTIKQNLSSIKRIETESRITEREYLSLLMEADTRLKQIRKTRYCLVYENQYIEIDIYPFWEDRAILEIELNDENQKYNLPQFIEVIKEVTEDGRYKNRALAEFNPKDNI